MNDHDYSRILRKPDRVSAPPRDGVRRVYVGWDWPQRRGQCVTVLGGSMHVTQVRFPDDFVATVPSGSVRRAHRA